MDAQQAPPHAISKLSLTIVAEKNNKNTYRTVMYEKLKEPIKEIAKGIEDNKNETAIQDPTGYTYAQTVKTTKKGSKENK